MHTLCSNRARAAHTTLTVFFTSASTCSNLTHFSSLGKWVRWLGFRTEGEKMSWTQSSPSLCFSPSFPPSLHRAACLWIFHFLLLSSCCKQILSAVFSQAPGPEFSPGWSFTPHSQNFTYFPFLYTLAETSASASLASFRVFICASLCVGVISGKSFLRHG